MDMGKQLADMDYFSPDPDFKVYHSAISLTPGVGSPFSLFCLTKTYEVLMLPSSPPHFRELVLLYANYES